MKKKKHFSVFVTNKLIIKTIKAVKLSATSDSLFSFRLLIDNIETDGLL